MHYEEQYLRQAFFQVRLEEDSNHLTTFCTQVGSFSFIHMPYGLTNSSCTFQKLMERVLWKLQWKICLVYLDDVITYSKDFESHMSNLQQIFARLRAANLKLHPGKCKFLYKQVKDFRKRYWAVRWKDSRYQADNITWISEGSEGIPGPHRLLQEICWWICTRCNTTQRIAQEGH